MPLQQLTPEILTAALAGYQHQARVIEGKMTEIQAMLRGAKIRPAKTAIAKPATQRRPLSIAARRRIAAAQKKRWAAFREAKGRGGRK